MNKISANNTLSANYTGDIITARHQLYSKVKFVADGAALFTHGLNTNIIAPLTAPCVTIENLCTNNLIITPGQNIIYVAKTGNIVNSGRNINEAVPTFTLALSIAMTLLPSSTNQVQIMCLEASTYTENMIVPPYVNISAINATLNGSIITAGYNSILFGCVQSSTTAITSAGPNTYITITYLKLTTVGVGVDHMHPNALTLLIDNIYIEDGIGIRVTSGPINCNIENITISGIGTGFVVNGSVLSARFNVIEGGSAINVNIPGRMSASGQIINCTTAYIVTGTLDLFIGELSGTQTGSANVLLPAHNVDYNNPHRTTLSQANTANPILISKGDLLGYDGSSIVAVSAGFDGTILTADSLSPSGLTWTSAGSGSVTSVGLTAPVEFTVTNSPVINSGILTLTKNNQSANTVWAGPTTGVPAQPTFRSLVFADIPSTALNTANTIVARNGSGNFAANIITASLNGNSSSATQLQTARTINGVAFDGTANIVIPSGGSGIVAYNLTNYPTDINLPTFQTASTFQWFNSRYNGYTNGIVLLRVFDNCTIRLFNSTTSTSIGSITITTNGSTTASFSFNVTNPIVDATLQLQVSAPGPSVPILHSAILEFTS